MLWMKRCRGQRDRHLMRFALRFYLEAGVAIEREKMASAVRTAA